MESKSKFKGLASAGLFFVTVYFLLNTALLIEWMNMQGTLSAFANVVFTIDCFTWHIYGLFAVIGFFIRVYINKNESTTHSKIKTALHFIFMLISFFEIYHMMQNAF